MSVDVEDYFQVEAFSRVVPREHWDSYPSRVELNTNRVLDFLDQHDVKATFFILGWVADKFPQLVRQIIDRGHEPACHSYWHRLIYSLTPEAFRQDTRLAKDCIEQACGQQIVGYRAPSFSITRRCPWAVDVLAELGFRYDSSVFPVRHDFYGIHDAPRKPFRMMTPSGLITEFPMTTFHLPRTPNLPVGGGGYLRMLPYWYTQMGINRALHQGVPLITYIHPWEFDVDQPRLMAPLTSRVRHYTNLTKTPHRLGDLLTLDEFGAFRDSHGVAEFPVWHFDAQADEVSSSAQQSDLERSSGVRSTGAHDWDLAGLPEWVMSAIDSLLDSASMVDLEGQPS